MAFLQALITTLAVAISTLSVLCAAQVCIWESSQDSLAEGEVKGRTYFGIWKCTALRQAATLPPHQRMPADEHQNLLTPYPCARDAAHSAKGNRFPNGTTTLSLKEASELWYQFVVDYAHMWRKVLESPPQVVMVATVFYACILMWGGFWDFRRVYFGRGDMYLGMYLIFCNYMLVLLGPQAAPAEAPRIEEQIYYGGD